MSLISKDNMSPEQIRADQANGRKSQGPVTEEGKMNIRRGHLKHGYYSQSFGESVAALGENREEYEALEADLVREWQPPNGFRRRLVKRLAQILWTLDRADRAQSAAVR